MESCPSLVMWSGTVRPDVRVRARVRVRVVFEVGVRVTGRPEPCPVIANAVPSALLGWVCRLLCSVGVGLPRTGVGLRVRQPVSYCKG